MAEASVKLTKAQAKALREVKAERRTEAVTAVKRRLRHLGLMEFGIRGYDITKAGEAALEAHTREALKKLPSAPPEVLRAVDAAIDATERRRQMRDAIRGNGHGLRPGDSL